MKKLFVLIFAISLFSVLIFSQVKGGDIYGAIFLEGGNPVPGCHVVATSVSMTTEFMTEEDGSYFFRDLPRGIYELRFEKEGFETITQADIEIKPGYAYRADVNMQRGLINVEITTAGMDGGISGRWESNIGLVYDILQEGSHFTWKVHGSDQRGDGTIETVDDPAASNLHATWHGSRGHGSATGKITGHDNKERPTEIKWSNGVIFSRADNGGPKTLTPGYDDVPHGIKIGERSDWSRLKANMKLQEIRVRQLEQYDGVEIDMLDIRALLENTGIVEPVTIELLDNEDNLLTNLGKYEPRIVRKSRQERIDREYSPFDRVVFDSIPRFKRIQGYRIKNRAVEITPSEEMPGRKIGIRILMLPQQCKLVFKDMRGRVKSILDIMAKLPIYKGYAFHQTWTFKGSFYDSNYNISFTFYFTFKGNNKSGDVYQYYGSTYSVGKYAIGKNTFEFTVSYFDSLEGADCLEVYKGSVIDENNMKGTVTRSWGNFKKTTGKWTAMKKKDHK